MKQILKHCEGGKNENLKKKKKGWTTELKQLKIDNVLAFLY
jgi:hypothetical protein